jgi:hypothetical protein
VRSADLRSCIDTCSSAFKSVYTVQLVSVLYHLHHLPARGKTRAVSIAERPNGSRPNGSIYDSLADGGDGRGGGARSALGAVIRGYVVAKALCAVLRWHVVTW